MASTGRTHPPALFSLSPFSFSAFTFPLSPLLKPFTFILKRKRLILHQQFARAGQGPDLAGLVAGTRHGHEIRYARTSLGVRLLAGDDRAGAAPAR